MIYNVWQYLGDSVYVDIERGMPVLYTDNGDGPQNKIFLEPGMLFALMDWGRAMRAMGFFSAATEKKE